MITPSVKIDSFLLTIPVVDVLPRVRLESGEYRTDYTGIHPMLQKTWISTEIDINSGAVSVPLALGAVDLSEISEERVSLMASVSRARVVGKGKNPLYYTRKKVPSGNGVHVDCFQIAVHKKIKDRWCYYDFMHVSFRSIFQQILDDGIFPVALTYSMFLARARVTDFDLCIDIDSEISLQELEENAKKLTSPSIDTKKGLKVFDKKENEGLQWGETREKAKKTAPFVKIYNKKLEQIAQGGFESASKWRLECTIKKSSDLPANFRFSNLGELLDLEQNSNESLFEVVRRVCEYQFSFSALFPLFFQESFSVPDSPECDFSINHTATDYVFLAFFSALKLKGLQKKDIIEQCVSLIPCPKEKSRLRRKLRRLYDTQFSY